VTQTLNIRLKFNHLFFNKLLRQHCLLCAGGDATDLGLCKSCLKDLPWHVAPQCHQCGLLSNNNLCGTCLSTPPHFDATHSVFTYDFPVNNMMQRYKYGNMLNLGQIFGQLLSKKVFTKNIDLIIPMPMHPLRLKERGFNQALEITKVLAKDHVEKIDFSSVQRQKLTPPQASLPLKDRVKSIKGVFKVNLAENVKNKRIAIVDDVMTTGASLNELAKTLKQAGASHVECWIVARTLPKY
jgi:ComF family protein